MSTQYLAKVRISLKPTVNDPEGSTIASALGSLGFAGVERVRSGRYFEITFAADSELEAGAAVDRMCQRLLANPVIEVYTFEVGPLRAPTTP